jgi:trans-aconitate methyltransferase
VSFCVSAGLGCDVDTWETTYQHVFAPDVLQNEPLLERTKGTALLPVFGVLTAQGERAEFVATYGRALSQGYPARPVRHGLCLASYLRGDSQEERPAMISCGAGAAVQN